MGKGFGGLGKRIGCFKLNKYLSDHLKAKEDLIGYIEEDQIQEHYREDRIDEQIREDQKSQNGNDINLNS